MATSTSSLSLSQSFLSRSSPNPISTHQQSNRLALSGSKPGSISLSFAVVAGRKGLGSRAATVRAAAVEAAEKTDDAAAALVDKSVNTIRFLSVDAVEKATSGHPGLPMGCAPVGHVLYDEVMRYNPKNPYWFNRDRFVLSAGHGCMLQYALLHLAGYDSVKVNLLHFHLFFLNWVCLVYRSCLGFAFILIFCFASSE